MIDFLFVSSLFGRVVANNASVAGATGGCQAEVGSASAMAALLQYQSLVANRKHLVTLWH